MPSKTKTSGKATEEAAVPGTASDPILANTNEGVETPFEVPVGADSVAADDPVTEGTTERAIEDRPAMITSIPDIPDEYDMDQYDVDRPKGTNRYLGIEVIPDIPERVDH